MNPPLLSRLRIQIPLAFISISMVVAILISRGESNRLLAVSIRSALSCSGFVYP